MKLYLFIIAFYFINHPITSQPTIKPCEIESIYYRVAYIADLGLKTYDESIFSKRKPENSWTYYFSNGLINKIKFDPTIGRHKEATIKYDGNKLVEVNFDGGYIRKIEHIYNEAGEIVKSINYSISGTNEKTYTIKNDTLIMTSWNEETNSSDVNEIIIDKNYKNLTFPFGPELYFDELFSVQTYYLDDDFYYEYSIDNCENIVLILKKFKGDEEYGGTIQKIISFEIKYK